MGTKVDVSAATLVLVCILERHTDQVLHIYTDLQLEVSFVKYAIPAPKTIFVSFSIEYS